MKELIGNLWNQKADVLVITTNGSVKADGRAVMGRGCALEAIQKFPELPLRLGTEISNKGNHTHLLDITSEYKLITLPVKYKWFEDADLNLIERSVKELVALANTHPEWKNIVLVRPGVGNGRLSWSLVEYAISPLLDDRFSVITNQPTNGEEKNKVDRRPTHKSETS